MQNKKRGKRPMSNTKQTLTSKILWATLIPIALGIILWIGSQIVTADKFSAMANEAIAEHPAIIKLQLRQDSVIETLGEMKKSLAEVKADVEEIKVNTTPRKHSITEKR